MADYMGAEVSGGGAGEDYAAAEVADGDADGAGLGDG